MGVDISMQAGWGVHIPRDVFDRWLEDNDPDEEGGHERLDRLLYEEYRGLSFDWPGNAWTGENNGWIIWISEGVQVFDMGREAQAGVYRTPADPPSAFGALRALEEVSERITGKALPVEYLISVRVD